MDSQNAAPESISVIIPNLHSPIVGEVIAALRAQTLAPKIREIVVVGMDRYGQVLPDRLVRALATPHAVPPGVARNIGAAEASGEFLLFLDADCLLAPSGLAQLIAALQQGFDAVVGGVVPEAGQYWRLCGNLMSFPEFLAIDPPGERDVLPSFCLCMTRSAWQRVGPFSDQHNAEDLDLSFRMRQAGYRLGCAPAARVYHRPARNSPGALWRRHSGFGRDFYQVYCRYRSIMPRSEAIWICERLPRALALLLMAALAPTYVARLMLRRPQLRRLWYAFPGMAWAQLGWYYGIAQATRPQASL